MAEIRLSTAGIKLYYATDSARPTAMSAYTEVPEIVSIPAVNETPNTLDATSLNETVNHVYIDGLNDSGGAISITANFSDTLLTAWNTTVIGAYNTAVAANKSMWFCVVIPGFTKAFYMEGKPAPIGMPSAEVDSVLQCTLPIIPTGDMDWYAAPTISG